MAKDPFKYFRVEARDLVEGLTQGILKLERGPAEPAQIAHLLRLAHTLKGAARVVKQPTIAEWAHGLEESLAEFRQGGMLVSKDRVTELLALLDQVRGRLSELALPAQQTETAREPVPESFQTVRVDIVDLDASSEELSEAAIRLSGLRREKGVLDQVRSLASLLSEQLSGHTKLHPLSQELQRLFDHLQRAWAVNIERADRDLLQVRERIGRMRLVEAHVLFATLERAVRDVAQTLNKRIEFENHGGDIRLEAQILSALGDALLHVVRNAAAHGIERESDRVAAGKPASGRISLRVERRGSRVAFICRDDGRGIDVEAIRRVAARKGLVPESQLESLGLEEAVRLLLKGGVTTTGAPTEVSGRGVGLDVVRDTVSRLRGDVRIESESGRGALIEITVPITLSSQSALLVDVAGTTVGLPLDSVQSARPLNESELARSGEGVALSLQGAAIPFVSLADLFGYPGRRTASCILVRSDSSIVAVGVDRILGIEDVAVRPLPAYLHVDPFVCGASISPDGSPQIHIDPKALFNAAKQTPFAPASTAAPRPPLLVVDDSLTTRVLEQSILESAGYEVDLATSAEEALAMARQRRYGVFVVDVEMPGMDGFDFVRTVRSDASLRDIPSILVTSRNAIQDRRRGEEVGAQAYIYKGEFDQTFLLRTIRRLLGEE